jgi:cbb3-type cytochrome oxidase cytochrome c subunit
MAFSRHGLFRDYDSMILLQLGTDLYSDCMTCHSATTYRCFLQDVSHVGATSTAADCVSDETFHFDKHIA